MKFKPMSKRKGSGGGASRFVKLNSGESITGVFMGEPYYYSQHWSGGSVVCVGEENGCEFCAAGDKPSDRFRINFVTKENDVLVSKIFEKGKDVNEILMGLAEDYNLEETVVKISRRGSDKNNTVYTITPLPESKLSDAGAAQVKAVVLQDLEPSVPNAWGGDDDKEDAL